MHDLNKRITGLKFENIHSHKGPTIDILSTKGNNHNLWLKSPEKGP